MKQTEETANSQSAFWGTVLFILGLLIAIVGGTAILPSSLIVSVLVVLIALNLCFIGIRLLSSRKKNSSLN
jgi:threonine/homoserine/homoserine lactone efflux protein